MTASRSDIDRAPTLSDLSPIVHGFSAELRDDTDVGRFRADLGLKSLPFVRLQQVHGAEVVRADDALGRDPRACGDALITDRVGVVLAIATADCVPVLLADPEARLIGAVHAGWRGMRSRIILRTVEAMVRGGAQPQRLRAAIGPAVQGTCYTVGEEVRQAFGDFPPTAGLFDDDRLDLVCAARSELAVAGLTAAAVSSSRHCTHCQPHRASHRRQGKARGSNLSVIALR